MSEIIIQELEKEIIEKIQKYNELNNKKRFALAIGELPDFYNYLYDNHYELYKVLYKKASDKFESEESNKELNKYNYIQDYIESYTGEEVAELRKEYDSMNIDNYGTSSPHSYDSDDIVSIGIYELNSNVDWMTSSWFC